MNRTTEFMLSLFRGTLEAFGPRETTEEEVVRVWLSMSSGLILKAQVKSKIVTKLAKRLSDHWKCSGDTRDFEDKKVEKLIRTKVKAIVDRAETLRRNSTKYFEDEAWMEKTRRLFQSVIVIESPPSEANISVPNIEPMDVSPPKTPTDDPDFVPDPEELIESKGRNYKTYPNMSMNAMRYGVSNQGAAAVINGWMLDEAIYDFSKILTADKVARCKRLLGLELVEEQDEKTGFLHLGADGKKSLVKMPENQWAMVDKQAVVCQSSRTFVRHYVPADGKGLKVADGFVNVLRETKSISTLKSFSSDGCPVMTGHTNGAIRHTEVKLNRPLQWIICLLHFVELCFKHLFEAIGKNL